MVVGFASAEVTVYSIQQGRGFAEAARILGADFSGLLIHDGWAPYLKFLLALHQTCLAHPLRRGREMIQMVSPSAARFPQTVKDILQQALQLRDRREARQISPHGLTVARGRLERLDRLLEPHYRCPANERFANHLYHNRNLLFTFLYYPGLEATHWRAEQALRPAVMTRKVWGGKRTENGARTQEVLTSVLETCRQQKRSGIKLSRSVSSSLPSPRPVFYTCARRRGKQVR